jgi:ethanolamine utilization protein EutQ (cupin superfamily)
VIYENKAFEKRERGFKEDIRFNSVFNFLTANDSERFSIAIGDALDHDETTKTMSDRAYFVLEGEIIVNGKLRGGPADIIFIPENTEYSFKGSFKAIIINSPPFKKAVEYKAS